MKALLLGLIRTQSMINNGTMSSSCSEGVPSSLNETSNCLLRSNIIESTFTGKSVMFIFIFAFNVSFSSLSLAFSLSLSLSLSSLSLSLSHTLIYS